MFLKKLLLTIVFSTPFLSTSPMNTGWFGKAAQAACWPCYPLCKIAEQIDTVIALNREKKSLITSTQNIKKQYPHAVAYVTSELIRAGFDPHRIFLIEANDAGSATNSLFLPFNDLEKQLSTENGLFSFVLTKKGPHTLPRLRATIAHEIGHLTNHDHCKRVLYPLFALGLIELGTRALPHWGTFTKWFGLGRLAILFAKTATAHLVINTLQYVDEYRADSAAIKRFYNDPEVLIARSELFRDEHLKRTFISIANACSATKKLRSLPCYWRLWHFINDNHPSHLSRAVRCARAAGQKITQKQLALATYNAVISSLSQSKPSTENID